MDFLPEDISRYAESAGTDEHPLLQKIGRETWQEVLMPRMLSGHQQGSVLQAIVRMIRPSRILEIGTFTGYSALCMGMAMPKDAELHSIDVNDELKKRVQGYMDESGLSDRIHLHWGNALEIIPELDETWDLVFIDADKENYLNYLNLVLPRMKSGGWIVADNVLWSGKVVHADLHTDEETQGLLEFTRAAKAHPDLFSVLFPIRDGLLVVQYVPNISCRPLKTAAT